ncbi:MAG: cation diffusion facilitator family transporter [Nocardioidaceae bacterium]
MSTGGSDRAVFAALAANLGIAVLKFGAWLVTGASSMLAEAIHSVADSGNQGLLLRGAQRAKQTPTKEHPFGFGRERYIYAFIVSIVMFTLGGLFALYEAYHKYQEVSEGHENKLLTGSWWWVPLVVLVAAIGMEGFSFRTAITQANTVRGEEGWVSYVRTSKAPEIPVVLFEDLAALIGLALALLGVGLTLMTRSGYWDVAGTAAIGALLVAVAVLLAIEIKSLLVGEGANPEAVARIKRALEAEPRVDRVIHLKTLHLGPDELLVAAKIAVRPTEHAADVAAAIDAAERRIRAAEPVATSIYLEPDIFRAHESTADSSEPPQVSGG